MNQHSKRGGQANEKSVYEVRRGATRPAAVVAIVLCVGFAVAVVAIWPFRKPPSHQEMQTQPKAAVQTEIPEPDAVQTEIPKPEAVVSVPHRAVPREASTATPVSQANPAARQGSRLRRRGIGYHPPAGSRRGRPRGLHDRHRRVRDAHHRRGRTSGGRWEARGGDSDLARPYHRAYLVVLSTVWAFTDRLRRGTGSAWATTNRV